MGIFFYRWWYFAGVDYLINTMYDHFLSMSYHGSYQFNGVIYKT